MYKERTVKAILIGNSNTGKTSFINQLVNNTFFLDVEPTISVNIEQYKYDNITFKIWDTSGKEIYRAINKNYMRDSVVVLMFYSITDRRSFEEIQNYYIEQAKLIYGNPSKYKQ